MLTLTSDQLCNWQEIENLLLTWNSSIKLHATATEREAFFIAPLTTREPERLTALLGLQETLRPYGITFSMEIIP